MINCFAEARPRVLARRLGSNPSVSAAAQERGGGAGAWEEGRVTAVALPAWGTLPGPRPTSLGQEDVWPAES